MPPLDPLDQAFIVGFFGCLMSALPAAMVMLLPRDVWARAEQAAKDRETIKALRLRNMELLRELALYTSVVDSVILSLIHI